MNVRSIRLCLAVGILAVSSARTGLAQEERAANVAIALRGGVTMSTSRGDFPSLIVGDSKRGTGTIGQQYGESGIGNRIDISALIPFTPVLGLSLGAGTQVMQVGYAADSARQATRFDVQTFQGQIGVQWSVLHDNNSYHTAALRSIYVDGGLDIGFGMLANRLESSAYADTLSAPPTKSVGSFTTGEPFRNVVALRGAVGMRFAATADIEIIAEASYAYALNPLFSSESIADNDFAIDVLAAVIGIGYRF